MEDPVSNKFLDSLVQLFCVLMIPINIGLALLALFMLLIISIGYGSNSYSWLELFAVIWGVFSSAGFILLAIRFFQQLDKPDRRSFFVSIALFSVLSLIGICFWETL